MIRWLLVLALLVVSITASARPGEAAHPAAVTDVAEASARAAERRVTRLAVHRAGIAKRYQGELAAIDRLKKQRASWRRDRELRDRLSDSLQTANLLSAATHELEMARTDLASVRRAYLAAIDAELSRGTERVRTAHLERVKALLVPHIRDVPRHIVIPDLEVDLLADPEELDQRAAELRASEDELSRQLAGLNAQAAELDRLAALRKQHERAGALVNRDDDQPHRNAPRKADPGALPDDPEEPSGLPLAPGWANPNFENYVPIVLADVIDASTINLFAAAQRSGDPAQRAAAARKAQHAVARRVEQLRRRRAEIEARARELRAKG
jgi:hypothetical protein